MAVMLSRPGIWVRVRVTRPSDDEIQIKVWSADQKGTSPSPAEILGAVIRDVHLAAGGPSTEADGRVSADAPTVFKVTDGVLTSTIVTLSRSVGAREILDAAWTGIPGTLRAMVGALGTVDETSDGIEASYGPAVCVTQPAQAIGSIPPARRLVDLAVRLQPAGILKFGR